MDFNILYQMDGEISLQKIVILINSLESGGAERVVSNLINAWAEKYDCYLILIHNYKFYELDKKINIINLNERKEYSGITKLLRLPILAYKLSKIIKANKFGKVTSFLTRANYINVISNLFIKHKTIISERAMPSLMYKYGINGNINRYLIKKLYPKADLCISNSCGNMMDLKDNFSVIDLDYIHNPFDIDKIRKMSNETIKVEKKRFTFVTVGRLDTGKNHSLIINAIKDLDADLWIIGDGELKNELEFEIQNSNLKNKVYLLGKKRNPFSYISKADCFVFSSNHEGFPNVLVEALTCALPIISTDCQSGPREILAPKSNVNIQIKDTIELSEYGILTPVNNLEKMIESMTLMIDNVEIRSKYSQKSMIRAKDFEISNIIKKFEKVVI